MSSQDVRDLCYMFMDDMSRVKNPELKEMGSISMLRRVLQDTDDTEILAIGIKVRVRLLGCMCCFFLSTGSYDRYVVFSSSARSSGRWFKPMQKRYTPTWLERPRQASSPKIHVAPPCNE